MSKKAIIIALVGIVLVFSFATLAVAFEYINPVDTDQELVGKMLYFDVDLSEPAGQACASCHHPDFGFADPDRDLPVSEGVIPGRFGNRNSPSAAYAMFFPIFTLKGGIQGGQFWDGRAPDLAAQARGPFLNPVEMNNTTRGQVIGKIGVSAYVDLFETVCGPDAFAPENVDSSYVCMSEAIAAFEMTDELNKFTSKFDCVEAGRAEFTPLEDEGRRLFSGSGKCGHCHLANEGGNSPVLFTDFKYHNIGLPNNRISFDLVGAPFVDLGLGGALNDPKEDGRFKSEHLRNIDLTPPYMHNGVLTDLWQVVHFYNTRDVLALCDPAQGNLDPGFATECWPEPEVPDNMDSSFVGDLGLTLDEEMAIVEFMKTFTDGYVCP